jgi:hypothetical protein
MSIMRKEEVHARLNEAVKNMTGREITSKKDQQAIRDEVNTYFYLRKKILDEALNFLKSDGKTAEEQRSRWENHLHTKGSESIQALSECIKGKPVTLFTTAISEVATQESDFYNKLADLRLPDVMKGRLFQYRKQFETEKESLEDKWEKLVSDNSGVNASIDDISEKLLGVYKDGLDKVDTAHTKLREDAIKYLTAAQLVDEIDPAVPSILTPVNMMIETLNNFIISSKDLAYRFEQLYRSEESVAVIMFGNTRKSVKEFLENTNLEKAQKDYYEAEKNARDIAKNMLTRGQQEDALAFVEEGTDITKLALNAFTEMYNSFVDSFKEIFIGPVGDRNVNDLIKKERWDWAKNEWKSLNIQTELKKIYDDSREWVDIDMFNLKPGAEEQVKIVLERERARLDLALNQAGDTSIMDSVKMYLTIVKDTMFSKIKNF